MAKPQRGAALIMLVMVVVISFSALLLKAMNLALPGSKQAGAEHKVLQQAKEGLVGYALRYADTHADRLPGYLPCPDVNGDGLANEPCGVAGQSALGRLPWRTLGLPVLRDSAGECLWYTVSGIYKALPEGPLSTDSSGQMMIVDNRRNPVHGVGAPALAVIFSAGKPVDRQNRTVSNGMSTECGSTRMTDGVNRASNYLDSYNGVVNARGNATGLIDGAVAQAIPAAGPSAFINAGADNEQFPFSFNDRLMALTVTDFRHVYPRMQSWVGDRVRQCLRSYALANGGRLPWPAKVQPGTWPQFNDNADQIRFGRIPANLSNSQSDGGLSPLWPVDPQQPSQRCFSWRWWPAFRESVFYAVDETIAPAVAAGALKLRVDGAATAAAILVAGRRGDSQARVSIADKSAIGNYLETLNVVDPLTDFLSGVGDRDFRSSDPAAVFFNDYVCSIESCP